MSKYVLENEFDNKFESHLLPTAIRALLYLTSMTSLPHLTEISATKHKSGCMKICGCIFGIFTQKGPESRFVDLDDF
jgi:hypothetical protein